jgi:cytochrome c biogenesis protein CcmG/thiol:disulfide interchange protein DsbE
MAAVGDHAGDFRLQDLDGRTVQLHKQLKDRAVLVLFTSVGCEPCEASSPALQQVGARFGDRLEVLCVALSELGAVRRWLDAGARFPGARILVGAGGSAPYDTARVYGVLGTPTAFLVGRDGLVYWRHVGRLTDDQVNDEIPGALDAATGGMLTQQGAL